jgi:hypothetical protein
MENKVKAKYDSKLMEPPTPLAKHFVRYLLGFGVGVALGLAPYLGEINVPFFKSLLTLIPNSLRDTVLPLSAALMGLIAIVVQWYGTERLSKRWLRRTFNRTILFSLFSLIALIVAHSFVVTTVPFLAGRDSASFVVGFQRPEGGTCRGLSDAECIKTLTFNEAKIESYWGDRQVRLSKLVLTFFYLLFTSSFGALVGLVVLKKH